jgi:aspartyl-tRNA synthetase
MENKFVIADAPKHAGEKLKLSGWVNTRRAHGKILFMTCATEAEFCR